MKYYTIKERVARQGEPPVNDGNTSTEWEPAPTRFGSMPGYQRVVRTKVYAPESVERGSTTYGAQIPTFGARVGLAILCTLAVVSMCGASLLPLLQVAGITKAPDSVTPETEPGEVVDAGTICLIGALVIAALASILYIKSVPVIPMSKRR